MSHNWSAQMRELKEGQSFVADLKDYESLITTSGRLKRRDEGIFKVKISRDRKNTVVTKEG